MADSNIPSSETGFVRPMDLGTRLTRERERLTHMTDRDRAYRRQYLLDQRLSPNEPVFVPEMMQATRNPIRRAYKMPLDIVFNALRPALGGSTIYFRHFSGRLVMGLTFMFSAVYYFKYNANDWTRKGGWRVTSSRRQVLPGEANYPAPPTKTKANDFAERGFKSSPI